jgi:flavin-dependent thymidylate synthase
MRIELAGFNLDSAIIEECRARGIRVDALTPETVAVAYARISRDPAPVTELRARALADVAAARRSAQAIIFEMNHQSVAEHAVFNFDILEVSRLAVEALEWHRLCSYTEKSQRYQELMGDYVVPEEFKGKPRAAFERIMALQKKAYEEAFRALRVHFIKADPTGAATKAGRRDLEVRAKEDARYVMGLATTAQLGFTANARNLEYIIRRLRAHPLHELRALGEAFFTLAGEVAPSLILLTDPAEYERTFGRPLNEEHFTRTHPHGQELARAVLGEPPAAGARSATGTFPARGEVRLIEHTPEPDRAVLRALLLAHSGADAAACEAAAARLAADPESGARFLREYLRFANPWESATREFEAADFTFEVVLSAACFGQMKRHRMTTQLVQPYDPALGCTYPPSVLEAGLEADFREVYERSAESWEELRGVHPEAAAYVLTNGHRRRMLVKADLRELYHIARLREDAHAQWDIRQVCADLLALARERAPLALQLAWGKDVFEERRRALADT